MYHEMNSLSRMGIIVLLAFCCIGAGLVFLETPQVETKLEPRLYTQVCQLCGQEWEVSPLDDTIPSPTIEWCFYDGYLCDKMYGMLVTLNFHEARTYQEVFDHCKYCSGCKYAIYTPKTWRDALKRLGRK